MFKLNDLIWKNRKVLVTGHTGFKGSWLCKVLSKHNADVFGFSYPDPQNYPLYNILTSENSSHGRMLADEQFGDVCSRDAVLETIKKVKPEVIFHLAAQPLVRKSYSCPCETFETNAIGTLNVLEAVRQSNMPCVVICITTDKVYDNPDSFVGSFSENDKLGGYDPYSASKAAAEIIIDSYCKSFFNPTEYGKTHYVQLASARAGNVIGGGDFAEDRIITDIIRSWESKTVLQVRNPKSVRPWQHVLEPLFGYIQLAQNMLENHDAKWSSSWNFGPYAASQKEVEYIVNRAKQLLDGFQWKDSSSIKMLHEANILRLNIDKAERELAWHPKLNLDEALDMTFAWYKHKQIFSTDSNAQNMIIEFTERQIEEYESKLGN